MRPKKDQIALGFAFVLAVALHAALLPWVGAAVAQKGAPEPVFDVVVTELGAPGYAQAGRQVFVRPHVEDYQDGELLDRPYHDRTDRLVLSRDLTVDVDDFVLRSWSFYGNAGDDDEPVIPNSALQVPPVLPEDADGPYFLIYQADADEQTPDANRSNNTLAKPIYIDGPEQPELSVETFKTPQRATAGGSILIDYQVRNSGKGWANTPPNEDNPNAPRWTDRVLLSFDQVPQFSDDPDDPSQDVLLRKFERYAPLGPDHDYRHERVELEIPRGFTGTAYLILMADADQLLDQPSFKRSIVVKPIEIVDTDAPDLVVASIEDPERLVIGRPSPVSFSIANFGSVPTVTTDWVDGLYLSKTETLDDTAIRIAEAPADQPLQPRSRYGSTVDVTLPDTVEPGQWFLIVKADADESIDEQGFDDNNTLALPIMVLTQAQADAEITLGDPDRPERMVIQWIEHDRIEEHRARLSRTVQPALQDKADPIADAPLNFDPKPPVVASKDFKPTGDPTQPQPKPDTKTAQDARPKPNAPDPTETDTAPRPQDPSSKTPKKVDGLPGDLGKQPSKQDGLDRPDLPNDPSPKDPTPSDNDKPTPNPGDREVKTPADPTAPDTDSKTDSKTPADQESDTDSENPNDNDATKPSEQKTDTPSDKSADPTKADKPTKDDGKGDAAEKKADTSTNNKPSEDTSTKPKGTEGDPASPSEKQDPTRVPKNDSEAPPTINREVKVALQEGRVLVGKGLKVTTKLPKLPGTGAKRFSVPRNARVAVTFDKDGKVYEAKVIRSTTYDYWDQAIESSLYRWTARGDAIDELKGKQTITIEWNYLINELVEGEAEEKVKEDGDESKEDAQDSDEVGEAGETDESGEE